jgi:Leucine-rich repeat (LRR) protein
MSSYHLKYSFLTGLEKVKKLEVLSLYGNEITRIQNLESLPELRVLRLGRNRIDDKPEIIR